MFLKKSTIAPSYNDYIFCNVILVHTAEKFVTFGKTRLLKEIHKHLYSLKKKVFSQIPQKGSVDVEKLPNQLKCRKKQ